MSIKSSIERLKDRRVPFNEKSYHDLKLSYEVLIAKDFLKNPKSSDLKDRIFKIEYSVDNVKEIIRLFTGEESKVINVFELRDFFSDIGFNVDVTVTETFRSDIAMVYNIGGYVVPFWGKLVSRFFKNNREVKRVLLHSLAPGKKRLHCRIYHGSDGAWYITSHVDHANWFNVLNPIGIFISHSVRGTGDYDLGTEIMKKVIPEALDLHRNKENLFIDINQIYIDERKEGIKTS